MPIFYLPFVATTISASLATPASWLPHIGTSSIKGNIGGAGFFWAISPSMDLLVGLEDYTLRGLAKGGVGFRVRPSTDTDFTVDFLM